uniref:non-ribosomal peptide synthetase n=1 Tax=Pseudomonas paralcaligenes TaxID=2772558 RepID=UPI0021D297F3|nr:non-ribosomal peptide synthetase [Pseudomonas paralcaligenes]
MSLPDLPIQYADYALWQRQWMENGELERQLSYWKNQLGDDQPVLELPTDRPRPAVRSDAGSSLDIQLDSSLAHKLKQLAQQQGMTLFMVLLASFQALLQRYSGQSDIRVGIPIANRNRVETEGLIGFFVNTQVLKAEFDPHSTFTTLLAQVKQAVLGAQVHQDLPFEQLVDALQPERSLSHSPLFQVMYNHQTQVKGQRHELPGLTVESLAWDTDTSQFDLMLEIFEHEQGIDASLNYSTALFDSQSIAGMAKHWQRLLEAIVQRPQQRLADLPLLNLQEQQRLVQDWNPAHVQHGRELCIHQAVEQRAAATPQAIAVAIGEQTLTYDALNQRANQFAYVLCAQGVGPDVRVGLAVERSLDMVVGILAILKAGGAYVPLDPEYPEARLSYMIEDSGIELLVTQAHLQAQLPIPAGVRSVLLDAGQAVIEQQSRDNPVLLTTPDNLAYVIYTSGSTGRPKGTLLPHHNVMRLFQSTQNWFDFNAQDVWSVFHSYAFDFSVWELFGALLYGGKAVLVPKEVARSPEDLHALLVRERVTVLNQTPSAFKHLIPVACDLAGSVPGLALRYVVFGGEALDVNSLQPWFARFGDAGPQLVNMYGITETTVHVTYRPLNSADLQQDALSPIGEVIPDLSWYLLDGQLNLAVPGTYGELHVGQAGLARGYHQRAALTAERFIPDPFDRSEHGGGRLYRTGDLARDRGEGVIEYVGRIDHQVKIRGFRIELGEIEARLQQCSEVREAVVLDIDGPSGKQLVAYLIAEAGQHEDESALCQRLRGQLKMVLPDYMVPAHWVLLDKLPLTANGKLDRKALPKPDASQLQVTYVMPQSELEQQIAAIWAEVLGIEQVGLSDNFFELGGDSIISIQVVSRARQAGIRFTPKQLFQHQTVQGLASVATQGDESGLQIDQVPASGELPLLPIQQRFFEQALSEPWHFNQSVILRARDLVDRPALQSALSILWEQHDALRLRFSESPEGCQARYSDAEAPQDLLWQAQVIDAVELEALGERAQRSLNLANGPLIRAVLADLADGSQRLILAIHHLAVDGVSWRILLEDLQQAYEQACRGEAVHLPARTSSVKAWAERLQQQAGVGALQEQLEFWAAQLEGVDTHLPGADAQARLLTGEASSVQTHLDAHYTSQLLQEAPAAYRTQVNDLLLTALARAINAWTGQAELVVQLEGHGRETLYDDIDLTRTVGWFTSMYPVRLRTNDDLGTSILQVKEMLRAVPDKGLGYGVLRYLGSVEQRERLQRLPEARVTFNYLGQFDNSFQGQASAFLPTGEAHGADISDHAPLDNWLSINGQVYGGELSLSWTFSEAMFEPAVMQRLADAYAAELRLLIEHCCDPHNGSVSPSDFDLATISQSQLSSLPLAARDIEDLYPLSPMQQGMLFHTLYEQTGGDYINQLRVDIHGLDPERFRASWQRVIERHQILRTSFIWEGLQRPVQLVSRQVLVPLQVVEEQSREQLEALAHAELKVGFDLSNGPLLRLLLVHRGEQSWHLIYTHHHILMDGWSCSQLMGEVMLAYAGEALPRQSGRYRDYIAWLARQDQARDQDFWQQELAGLGEPSLLTDALPVRDRGQIGYSESYVLLSVAETGSLEALARNMKVTVNTLVQGAWALVLQRYLGRDEVVFGATVSGRPAELKGIEQQVGLFINTLPVRFAATGELGLAQVMQALQARNLNLREYEHTPLFDIQRWTGQGGSALFDSLVVFENYPISEALEAGGSGELSFGQVLDREQSHYPLTLVVGLGQQLSIELRYNLARLDQGIAKQLAIHLQRLLTAFGSVAIDTPVGELDILGAERDELIHALNPQAVRYTSDACLHQRIAAWAIRAPQAVALSFDGAQLSYVELNIRANRLAHRLIAAGVGPEVRVGLVAERSLELVVGLLAILKAGGAYVPLDPMYPSQRLEFMMQDSGIALLLSQPGLKFPNFDGPILALDEDLTGYSDADPQVVMTPANLAYIIYTSGSTGKPKGTLLSHHNVQRLFAGTDRWFGFNAEDTWTLFHSYAFDFSVWEIFGALLHGGRLVIVPYLVSRSPEDFHELLINERVTVLNQTPSAFRQLMHVACADSRAHNLRTVVFGGEALEVQSLRPWFERFGDAPTQLINMYGITETTVHVTYRPLSWTDLDNGVASPIGLPIPDLSWYVLDGELNPVPAGCVGELYVGRDGLARGYLNRGDLSAARFLPDPHGADGGRLYRTGDLARLCSDGAVEYIGRMDQQVKIRGFRIELGEIEARLSALAGVREAVVLVDEDRLVAYVVPTDEQDGLREQLAAQLKADLPDYMVPSLWQFLTAMPLTGNGKLDRKALPKPEAQGQEHYAAPEGELEQRLAVIWQEVLGIEQIGRHDHFFELGGHSLLATQMVARCRDSMPCPVQLRDLFNHPVLADLAAALQGAEVQPGPAYPRLVRNEFPHGVASLSLAQRRLWVVEQLSGGGAAYGMPLALRLHGELSVERLLQSLAGVVARHDVLRTAYLQDDEGDPIAVIQPHISLDVPVLDISDWPRARQEERVAEDTLDNARQPIDMEQAPLWRARILKLAGDEHVLLFSMHHIISDGWSMGVLVNELVTRYGQLTQGLALEAPALPIQYADYAVWQLRLEESGVLGQQAVYWRDTLAGYSGQLDLPFDTPRNPKGDQQGGVVSFTLSEALSERLRGLAQAAGVTPYIALLTAFGMFLQRLSGCDDVVIGADIAGRHQPELEGLIGFFVNVLPLRSNFSAEVTFAERLVRMRQVMLDALEHQDLPFDHIVESAGAKRIPGMNPLVQVLFVMDNLPARASSLHGVQVEEVPNSQVHSKFDMALFMGEQDKCLSGAWQYASSLYRRETIEAFVSAWTDTLEHIAANQSFTVGDIDMAVAPSMAPQINANSKEKADKLGKFLKKGGATIRPLNAAVREYPLLPDQAFPLVMEPNDPGLDLVGWVAANRPLIEARLGENAGILFRGFEVNGIEGFEAFAEAVQPGLYGQYGDLPKKEGGKNTYRSTPYPEQKMILFHNESSHQDRWPRKQMFYCELPSPIGGATPVVDCRVMYQRLPQALRQTLEEKGLLYIRTFTGFDVPWQHFFKTEERASVEARCRESGIEWQWLEEDGLQIRTWCPAIITHPITGQRSFFNQVQLHHPFWLDADVRDDLVGMFGNDRLPRNVYYGDGSSIAEADLQAIGELYEACAVRFDWRKGDIILLDNMLVAHARDPFEGPRKIVVAMGDMVDRVALVETRPQMTRPAGSKESIDV